VRPWLSSILIAIVAVGCSSTDSGTIQLVTGAETDVFSASPQPKTLKVIALDSNNNASTIATASLPTDSIDLGQQDESAVATLAVEGLDANNNQVVFGASLPIQYGAIAGATLPIFVQRTNEFARLPSPPNDARLNPMLAVIGERFLIIGAGNGPGDPLSTQIYDFASLSPLDSPPSLPRVPLSMPVVGTVALLIDQNGGTYYDFSQSTGGDTTPPSGHTFAEVAGGAVLYDNDTTNGTGNGYVYVVGGTRTTGSSTATVLLIDTNDTSNSNYPKGNLHWLSLSAPRFGAAATVIPGRGVFVTGGSVDAPGVELIPDNSTTSNGSALPYPPDGSIGAGVTSLDDTDLLVAGGLTATGADAGIRELSVGCTSNCGTTGTKTWGGGSLPTPLTSVAVYTLNGGNNALVVGNELTSGLTHAYLLDSTQNTAVATRVSHFNAQSMVSPTGTVLLFGGATEIESFTTPQNL
jgi:hypothetical protein